MSSGRSAAKVGDRVAKGEKQGVIVAAPPAAKKGGQRLYTVRFDDGSEEKLYSRQLRR